jgi:hypothetical protein
LRPHRIAEQFLIASALGRTADIEQVLETELNVALENQR